MTSGWMIGCVSCFGFGISVYRLTADVSPLMAYLMNATCHMPHISRINSLLACGFSQVIQALPIDQCKECVEAYVQGSVWTIRCDYVYV